VNVSPRRRGAHNVIRPHRSFPAFP
jgi:hypothetical protein